MSGEVEISLQVLHKNPVICTTCNVKNRSLGYWDSTFPRPMRAERSHPVIQTLHPEHFHLILSFSWGPIRIPRRTPRYIVGIAWTSFEQFRHKRYCKHAFWCAFTHPLGGVWGISCPSTLLPPKVCLRSEFCSRSSHVCSCNRHIIGVLQR